MDKIPEEILIDILNYLNEYEKIKINKLNHYFNDLYWYFLDKRVVLTDRNYVAFLQFYYKKLPKITHIQLKNFQNPNIHYSIYPYLKSITLNLGFFNYQNYIDNIPNNLEHLKLGYTSIEKLINLPNNLESLEIYNWYGQKIEFPQNLKKITFINVHSELPELPQTVRIIKIGFTYKISFLKIPNHIEFLYTNPFNKKIISILKLPQNIKIKFVRYL